MTVSAANLKASDLKRLLGQAQLPGLPNSAIKLLELSQNPDNGPAEFSRPIEADPGLTGQVLKFVNSSYFGFAREISSVKLAITLVGIRTIKNFALWSAVFSLMPNPRCGPFDLKSLWQDALRRGLFARTTGKLLGLKDAEDVFAAALLQDMAIPILAKELPAEYVDLLGRREGGQAKLSDLEREQFGWTHAEAAGEMARTWNLPRDFSELVAGHVDAIPRDGRTAPAKTAVCLSALLPPAVDDAWYEVETFEQSYQRVQPAGGPSVPELLEKVDAEFADIAPLLKLNSPVRSLVDIYQATIG